MSAREELEGLGIPPELLDQHLAEVIQAAGQIQAQQAQAIAADPILSRHGDAIARHIAADPELSQQVTRVSSIDFAAGLRLARDSWLASQPGRVSQSGPRPWQNHDPSYTRSPEELRQEWERTGDPRIKEDFIRSRLHRAISESHMQNGNG